MRQEQRKNAHTVTLEFGSFIYSFFLSFVRNGKQICDIFILFERFANYHESYGKLFFCALASRLRVIIGINRTTAPVFFCLLVCFRHAYRRKIDPKQLSLSWLVWRKNSKCFALLLHWFRLNVDAKHSVPSIWQIVQIAEMFGSPMSHQYFLTFTLSIFVQYISYSFA